MSDASSVTAASRVRSAAGAAAGLDALDAAITGCRACSRLVAWREEVAVTRRAAYAEQEYWGRPVAGFGPADAAILILGLAPGAHGANRTGRVFTGDRSGDWLYGALHRVGMAGQAESVSRDDGMTVTVRISAAVRCAPPDNRPTPAERDTCAGWLEREVALLPRLRVLVALGGFAWTAALSTATAAGWSVPRPRPRFGHGAQVQLDRPGAAVTLIGCYHPSQQNTFTGRLTEPMLDDVLTRAAALAG